MPERGSAKLSEAFPPWTGFGHTGANSNEWATFEGSTPTVAVVSAAPARMMHHWFSVPMSSAALSETVKVQVPAEDCPLKFASAD